ncbi:beta-galactosidase [Cohnella thailandensis]|uniref:Beta-galactosidase n=1 Tax=Cohnella thailandensis TaxID=557557 RepID=A0A841SRQ6_9BACL|nr:beta-galactosidase [Cohnella thailandensis]MBB6632868.1 beta-galactosidase [Cohnella thailandensis]MBP1975438.1 beta-galactosidase [Cohnella thailandensis]
MLNERKAYRGSDFLLGVCYYPEHWKEACWAEDFRRMSELGFNTVRMGETAWNVMEPEEGKYDFSLFDRAIEGAAGCGLRVILGTPTYAPPAWLTDKYPETLRVDFGGRRMAHGSRRHYNYTSATYLRLCDGIVSAMADRYKDHPAVIGWQIDNELNCHSDASFAPSDHDAFREWCRTRYGTLQTLNEAWGTAFWAQTYTDWGQVALPKPTVTYHNPSHLLDFYRFTSESAIAFAERQYRILKGAAPHQFATHNGMFGNIDYKPFTERAVDFLSYDSYPSFQLMRKDVPVREKDKLSGKHLSRMRGYSGKYMILEQQAGPGGQTGNGLNDDRDDYLQVSPKPGQIRLWTWQSIAHGADGVLYFRWRTCPYGAETLWHGLNDYGNQPNRRLEEARAVALETGRLSKLIVSTSVHATAAILSDYDNDSNCKIDRHTGSEYWRSEENIYLALASRHIGTDMLDLGAASEPNVLNRYEIVFAPNVKLLDEHELEPLRSYASQGGTLVFGPRAGYKDRNNHAHMLPFPGVVRTLAGIAVEDFTMVDGDDAARIRFGTPDKETAAPLFHEILEPEADGCSVLAEYVRDYYAGRPAIAVRPYGRGRIVYVGTFFTLDNTEALLDALGTTDPSSDWADNLPAEVETVYRREGEKSYVILLNYSDEPKRIRLKRPVLDVLSQTEVKTEQTLPPYGVSWWALS